jgi:hypothetical protein
MLADEPTELLGGVHGLQTAIEASRSLDITVAKKPTHGLVVAEMVLQINRCRGVPELVNCEAKSGRFLHAHGDLFAEEQFMLRLTGLTREQPRGIRAAKQRRSELMNVYVNQVRQRLIELEIQVNPIFHIIVRKHEPIRRVDPAGLDKVLAQLDLDEIAKANGRETENRNGSSKLRRNGSFNRRMVPD